MMYQFGIIWWKWTYLEKSYIFFFLLFLERSLAIFLVFFMSIPCASRVFFITISWFISFCGCFLSVSESYSGRLNDCFLTVPEFFCFYRECFWSTQRVFSCQPLDFSDRNTNRPTLLIRKAARLPWIFFYSWTTR